MTRVYLADALTEERSALCLLLVDLKMEVVGKAEYLEILPALRTESLKGKK